jgi:HTH-type transcriptional regulator / antitoxin HigA
MDRGSIIRLQPDTIPHPGEMVQEYLELNGWSQRDLARRTDLAPKTISEICNGKAPITPPTALAFERVFRRPAHLWLNFQRQYDEAQARAKESERFFKWSDWLRKFPLKEMRERNFAIPEGTSDMDSLLNFFGVSSPESWRTVWDAYSVSYRQTHAFKVREESVAAWVREVEIQARAFPLRNFDEHLFVASLPKLKSLSRLRVDESMISVLQETCANFGVAVVIVPELPNTGISGCARWLTDTKALVGLTLRYKTDDQLWFTLFHELGHILLHRNKKLFVVDNAAEDLIDRVVDPEMQKFESEANQFSSDTLVPPTELSEFLRKKEFTSESIYSFAERIGVGPGIVVGRLQHDKILKPHQGNAFKQTLKWATKKEG